MRIRSVLCTGAFLALLTVGSAAWAKDEPAGKVAPGAGTSGKEKAPATPIDETLLRLLVTSDAEPDEGPAPLTVEFSADVYEGDDAVNPKFKWDFGDASPQAVGQKVAHTYKKPGTYNIRVQVREARGRTGSDDLRVDVDQPEEHP
jgi:hypothetical protein